MKLCGWSNVALGKMLGLSRQCISGIMKGKQKMTMAQYIAIRHLLDSWIFDHADDGSTLIYRYVAQILNTIDGGKNWTLCIFEESGIIF